MRRVALTSILVGVLVGALLGVCAFATPGLVVHIEVTGMWSNPDPHSFAASGPAVAGGLISAVGEESTGPVAWSASPLGANYAVLSMEKYLSYGGGTLTIRLVCTLDLVAGNTWGDWNVLSGAGARAGITGGGTLVGTPTPLHDGIVDVWDGRLKVQPVLEVEITVPTPLPAVGSDTFTASGPAVVRGLLPTTGQVSTGPITVAASSLGDRYLLLSMVKYFVCDDGAFDVSVVVTLDNWTGSTWGDWRVLRGTGAYVTLKGSGTIVGTFIPVPYSVLDVYSGHLKK